MITDALIRSNVIWWQSLFTKKLIHELNFSSVVDTFSSFDSTFMFLGENEISAFEWIDEVSSSFPLPFFLNFVTA
jgi:hypothetical protein